MHRAMIIDVHAHIMRSNFNKDKSEIRKAIDLYGISRVYVSALDESALSPDEVGIALCNAATHRFMQECPDHIRGYCYVNPNNPDCMDVLRKGFETYGMSGAKLWVACHCDCPQVFPVVEFCQAHGWPLLIHTFHKAVGQLADETLGEHVANLSRCFPDAQLIMAHLGGNCYNGVKAIRSRKNVWVDFSGSVFRKDDLDYAVEMLGEDRILFGTDFPRPGSFLANYGKVLDACLTEEQRRKILYQNAEKLFGGD